MVTGRHKIIARYRSYHGGTAGAITLTGDPRRWAAEPGIPGVVRAMDPYRYRCRFCGDRPACTLDCLNNIEDVIMFEGAQNIAAVIVEPVTGTNGIIMPPDGYMQGLRELCTRHGIMLICRRSDERLWTHRQMVRRRSLGRHARHHDHGEGSDLGLCAARRDDGDRYHRRRTSRISRCTLA